MGEDIKDNTLQNLFRALPEEKPSVGLNARIMERVRQEHSPAERRTERWTLFWTIGLSTVMLGLGVWALYATGGWQTLVPETFVWPEIDLAWRWEGLSPEAVRMLRMLLPYAGIVLLLLVGDLLLRRHFFMKNYRKQQQ